MERILICIRCGCNRGSIIFQLFISEFPEVPISELAICFAKGFGLFLKRVIGQKRLKICKQFVFVYLPLISFPIFQIILC